MVVPVATMVEFIRQRQTSGERSTEAKFSQIGQNRNRGRRAIRSIVRLPKQSREMTRRQRGKP